MFNKLLIATAVALSLSLSAGAMAQDAAQKAANKAAVQARTPDRVPFKGPFYNGAVATRNDAIWAANNSKSGYGSATLGQVSSPKPSATVINAAFAGNGTPQLDPGYTPPASLVTAVAAWDAYVAAGKGKVAK